MALKMSITFLNNGKYQKIIKVPIRFPGISFNFLNAFFLPKVLSLKQLYKDTTQSMCSWDTGIETLQPIKIIKNLFEIMLEIIFNNPGLKHITENIFCNLRHEDLKVCRNIDKY